MRRPTLRHLVALPALLLSGVVVVGGGGTYVALEFTTRPQFCRSCHIMEPYYESWASSSHSNVACVDCHYEPGLLETFEGKFKALSQLAKYATGTQGTKPWAEVSDYSCMRSGCHSERLLEGEISYGRIRFDHRHHLIGYPRGKKLRCTSCHSQIVQGNHLTVTKSSCILCHFMPGKGMEATDGGPIDDCNTCHGPPRDEIELGGFVFRHSEYLERGVQCRTCHGDITRGTGEVPRARCGSCHNKQEHLDRYGDVEFIHRHHVTEHSVNCLECHTEIEHGLPPREKHARGDCRTCHKGTHGAPASIYRGTGGRGVEDRPGVMFLARVTCAGCHRPPFPGAAAAGLGGTTFEADPLACLDCHGPGYEGMAGRWQAEVRAARGKLQSALKDLAGMLEEEWEDGDPAAARKAYERAAYNLGLVAIDKSDGVHNLPYVRSLMRRCYEDLKQGYHALDPDESPGRIHLGPRVASKQGCTQLCHAGIETAPRTEAFGLPFPHARHLLRAKLDCSKCHADEPHGTTRIKPADCRACHHQAEEAGACGGCHVETASLWKAEAEGDAEPEMRDLDCLACHETLAEGHSREGVKQACLGCHEDEPEGFFEAWRKAAVDPVEELWAVRDRLPEDARRELEALRRVGPFHNGVVARERIAKLHEKLAPAR